MSQFEVMKQRLDDKLQKEQKTAEQISLLKSKLSELEEEKGREEGLGNILEAMDINRKVQNVRADIESLKEFHGRLRTSTPFTKSDLIQGWKDDLPETLKETEAAEQKLKAAFEAYQSAMSEYKSAAENAHKVGWKWRHLGQAAGIPLGELLYSFSEPYDETEYRKYVLELV